MERWIKIHWTQTKNFGSTLEMHPLHPPEGLLFFVLFSFIAEIHFFTAGILEILTLCFGAKSSNSKVDCTAAILCSSSGNEHCNDLFSFSLPNSHHLWYVPRLPESTSDSFLPF